MKYLFTILAIIMSIPRIIFPAIKPVFNGGEEAAFENWSKDQAFTEEYAVRFDKTPGKDFVVLNLTDVQYEKWDAYSENGQLTADTIDYLIKTVRPDLITLTGDNAYSTSGYLKFVRDIDGYGIPWAPVMGNHDGTCCVSEFWCAAIMSDAENCVFRLGPSDMGYGNYIINIYENDEIIHTFYMMDTHSDLRDGANINGEKDGGYDHLWANQLEWYEWAVNGIAKLEGHTVESTVLFHIPTVEYRTAWDEAYDEETKSYTGEYAAGSYGENRENVCCAPRNNGFFGLCKELGSTKNIICGHDHSNNSSIVYDGIRLTYSLKTGPCGYWEEGVSGGTTITVNGEGHAQIEHVYADIK